MRVLREHYIFAWPTLFSLPIDVGRLKGSWVRFFHIRGDFVVDVEAGVNPGLLLERSHAGPGEGELLALTVTGLVHKLYNIKVQFNTLFRVIKACQRLLKFWPETHGGMNFSIRGVTAHHFIFSGSLSQVG